MLIDLDRIAGLIPHSGTMCLLHSVESWDNERIACLATSHRSADNPLRRDGRLGVACGVEYAAQAMALHAALNARSPDRPGRGYLASLRSVTFAQAHLDTVPGFLVVKAACLHRETDRAIYDFAIRDHERDLLQGRAVVVFGPGGP